MSKGDTPRPVDAGKYAANFDAIRWKSRKKTGLRQDTDGHGLRGQSKAGKKNE